MINYNTSKAQTSHKYNPGDPLTTLLYFTNDNHWIYPIPLIQFGIRAATVTYTEWSYWWVKKQAKRIQHWNTHTWSETHFLQTTVHVGWRPNVPALIYHPLKIKQNFNYIFKHKVATENDYFAFRYHLTSINLTYSCRTQPKCTSGVSD